MKAEYNTIYNIPVISFDGDIILNNIKFDTIIFDKDSESFMFIKKEAYFIRGKSLKDYIKTYKEILNTKEKHHD